VKKIIISISAVLGICTAVLLTMLGDVSLVFSGIIGIFTAVGTFYAIPSAKENSSSTETIFHSENLLVTNSSERETAQLESLISQVPESSIKTTLTSIFRLAKQLQGAPLRDPRDEIDLRSFFNHYLPATVTICSRYLELSQQPYQTEELQETLNNTEQTLQRIESAFHKQLSNLLQNDILDLNVEVSVLEHSLRLDGLVEDKSNSKDHL